MAVKIRLARMGDKHSPVYRMVVADSRSARDTKAIEVIGTYNPLTNPATLNIKADRVTYWLGCGAIPTETAKELLIKQGLIEAKPYVAPRPKKMPPAKKEKPAEAEQPAEDAQAPAETEATAE